MSTTPGATNEYSTGIEGSRAGSRTESGPAWRAGGRRSAARGARFGRLISAVALVGAALLVAAEFATLYQAHLATKVVPIASVTTGSHNSYALIPIGVLAAALGVIVWRSGNRLALLAIGVLGVVALLIALLHDLPDTHAVGLAEHNSVSATTTPQAGLYLETLGAILLIAISGLAFMTAGSAGRRRRAVASGRGAAEGRADRGAGGAG